MFEKVNPSHPDKLADRIAGALTDYAYLQKKNPKVAIEVLIGHGNCHIIIETDVIYEYDTVCDIVKRITKPENIKVDLQVVAQDTTLAENQSIEIRCGDNGIFKGVPMTEEEKSLTYIVKSLYEEFSTDGKYLISGKAGKITICQSQMPKVIEKKIYDTTKQVTIADYLYCNYGISQIKTINPLGEWTGGIDVDTGATNRKLGSDMGNSVTGGGLFGKDLSKADASVNVYCFLQAQRLKQEVKAMCSIGDTDVYVEIGETNYMIPFKEVVAIAKNYIDGLGGFEKFAEWGLIR